MNIAEYWQTTNGLKAIYDAAAQELKETRGWESFSGDWWLSHVGINNDGSLTAVVTWGMGICKDQWVGISWENVINRLKK